MTAPLVEAGVHGDELRCPYCSALLSRDGDEEADANGPLPIPPCPHVYYLGWDGGVIWLSPGAWEQLAAAGVAVSESNRDYLLELPAGESSDDYMSSLDIIRRYVELPGAQVLAQYVGPPSFEGNYWGVHPDWGTAF